MAMEVKTTFVDPEGRMPGVVHIEIVEALGPTGDRSSRDVWRFYVDIVNGTLRRRIGDEYGYDKVGEARHLALVWSKLLDFPVICVRMEKRVKVEEHVYTVNSDKFIWEK